MNCYLTGPEYWLAIRQGWELNIKSAFYIQLKTKKVYNNNTNKVFDEHEIKPFQDIIKDIPCKRREFKKGKVENALYKEKGNSSNGKLKEV